MEDTVEGRKEGGMEVGATGFTWRLKGKRRERREQRGWRREWGVPDDYKGKKVEGRKGREGSRGLPRGGTKGMKGNMRVT